MYISRRGFSKISEVKNAAQAAVRAKEQPGFKPQSGLPQQHELKVTKLPNNLQVASVDSGASVSRITVAVKSGARYEPKELPGLAHALRNAAPLATKYCTAFGLVRNLEQLGATLRATTTRDHTIYSLACPRENIHDALRFLAYVTTQQDFRHWEVMDSAERMRVEIEVYKQQPQLRLIEYLHKAAYRGGLANSLYAKPFAYKHLNSAMLTSYVKQTFSTDRMTLAATGIHQEPLLAFASDFMKFDMKPSQAYYAAQNVGADYEANVNSTSRYVGGEYFKDTLDHLAYGAIVTEGAGYNKPEDVLALALLREVLGTEPHIKWSNGTSALTKAAQTAAKNPVAISALNISHSDSGLFGFSVVASAKDIGNVLKAGVDVMKGKAGLDEKRFQAAKNRLLSSILIADEEGANVVDDLAVQLLNSGSVVTASDAVGIVNKLTQDQLVTIAKKVTSGKPTLVGVGNLSHFPRLDDLLRQ